MSACNEMFQKHDIESTALAMKTCHVQLVHKVKLDLKKRTHTHKMRLDLILEGSKEQAELMKWHFSDLMDKKNKWQGRTQIREVAPAK